jgi:hypothetical protein
MSQPRQRSRRQPPGREAREWVGALLSPPFFIEDREEPYRAGLVLWMELPEALVVANEVIAPETSAGAVGRALRAALEQPFYGPPRRPTRIRVPDAALALEVRDVVGTRIPIEVAPTPELGALLEQMIEGMDDRDEHQASYLGDGRVPADAMAELFRCAEQLWRIAPWNAASDDQVLRMDIPALGVEGACLSIIGELGESFGVMIFPSLAGYQGFLDAADAPRPAGSTPRPPARPRRAGRVEPPSTCC